MNGAISIRGVSKSFPVVERPLRRLKNVLTGNSRGSGREFWALRDVDLEVEPGTTLGILGQNGSGKSTLLQLMAGIMHPTLGRVLTRGRISTLLELGAGFDPDFTGRENVRMSGHILGFSSREIEGRLADIVEFAELGDFIDRPTRTYSSGMYVRLAFSTAVSLDPDILLVDEVLAVGDTYFQHKCVRKIRQFQEEGRTIVYVTHDIESMRNVCDRAVIVDYSRIIADGAPDETAKRYMALIDRREKLAGGENGDPGPLHEQARKAISDYSRYGEREAEIAEIAILDGNGAETETFAAGEEMAIRFGVRFHRDVRRFVLGVIIRNQWGSDVFGTNNHWQGQPLADFRAGESARVEFRLPAAFASGSYSLNPAASSHLGGDEYRVLDWINNAALFRVRNPRRLAGYAEIPCKITVEKCALRE